MNRHLPHQVTVGLPSLGGFVRGGDSLPLHPSFSFSDKRKSLN